MASSYGFDTDRYIIEIEDRAAIWDVRTREYSNKILKAKAWEEMSLLFVPNFNEFDSQGKMKATADLQRRWKSLRDCFRREFALSNKEKSGSGASSNRKEYLFYRQLSFLHDICATKPKVAESSEDIMVQEDNQKNPREPAPPTSNSKRRKSSQQLDEATLLEALAKKASVPHNHDKDFFMGLVPDFQSIPESFKFDAKYEIMNIIKKYKQQSNHPQYFPTYQQTSYNTPASYNTPYSFVPSVMHALPVTQSQPCTPSPAPQNFVPTIMQAHSVTQSQPVLPGTPSPASETQLSPWSDGSGMSNHG